ncbi:MAG: glutamate-cysteine ligase family protein, partial [Candidatus Peregrinibacteria bacterium]
QPLSLNREIEDIMVERKREILHFFERIQRETGNDFGLAWYKKTSGIHINVDYRSEADFSRKSKTLLRLAPVLNAIFANSPFSKKKFTGYMSYRRWLTLHTGIPTFNTPQKLYESDFTYEDWGNHILSLNVAFLKKEQGWIHPNMPFSTYIKKGFEGHHATLNDFNMHFKGAWTDIRMRNVIEIRCIDSLPPALVPATAALIKGLIYDDMTLLELKQLTDNWTFKDYQTLLEDAARNALQASIRGIPLLTIAKLLLQLAKKSLSKHPIINADGEDESIYLEPIQEFILLKEKSPAEWLVEQWLGPWNKNFYPVIEWCRY